VRDLLDSAILRVSVEAVRAVGTTGQPNFLQNYKSVDRNIVGGFYRQRLSIDKTIVGGWLSTELSSEMHSIVTNCTSLRH